MAEDCLLAQLIERLLTSKPTLTHFYSATIYDPQPTLGDEVSRVITCPKQSLDSFENDHTLFRIIDMPTWFRRKFG